MLSAWQEPQERICFFILNIRWVWMKAHVLHGIGDGLEPRLNAQQIMEYPLPFFKLSAKTVINFKVCKRLDLNRSHHKKEMIII